MKKAADISTGHRIELAIGGSLVAIDVTWVEHYDDGETFIEGIFWADGPNAQTGGVLVDATGNVL